MSDSPLALALKRAQKAATEVREAREALRALTPDGVRFIITPGLHLEAQLDEKTPLTPEIEAICDMVERQYPDPSFGGLGHRVVSIKHLGGKRGRDLRLVEWTISFAEPEPFREGPSRPRST